MNYKKIIFSFIFIAIFSIMIFNVPVNAAQNNNANIQALIRELQAQIARLQQQILQLQAQRNIIVPEVTLAQSNIVINSPVVGQRLISGTGHSIRWTSTNLRVGQAIHLFYRVTGGQWIPIANLDHLATSHEWRVPNVNQLTNIDVWAGLLDRGSWLTAQSVPAIIEPANRPIDVLQPPIIGVPTILASSISQITHNSADLLAQINPNGVATEVWFEYGVGSVPNITTLRAPVAASNVATSVTLNAPNLLPNTNYTFRVVAQNAHGTTRGNIMSFRTLAPAVTATAPVIITQSSSSVTHNSADLLAQINPNGVATEVWFEYGVGSVPNITTLRAPVAASNVATSVTLNAPNLLPNTNYTFRVVAQNAHGTTRGNIMFFRTLALPPDSIPADPPFLTE